MSQQTQKLRLNALIALVVGSMIGGGIFSLPQNIAEQAAGGAVLIGWSITAVGMLALAFVFQTLANRKPELDSGVYAYARGGFGDYMGFSSAWGYWISSAPWATSFRFLVRATRRLPSVVLRYCCGACTFWYCAGSRRPPSSTN